MKRKWRLRLISLVAAAVLTVLASSAIAVWMHPLRLPEPVAHDGPGLQSSLQPACDPKAPANTTQSCVATTAVRVTALADGVEHSALPAGLRLSFIKPRAQRARKIELKGASPQATFVGASKDEAGQQSIDFPAMVMPGETIYLWFTHS